jgi:predicted peroxiredoxin
VTALAAILSTREPERLYSGLSVLVSRAGDGEECAALVSFGALELMLDPDPGAQGDSSQLFARSLAELRDTALAIEALRFYACSASIETMDVERELVERRLGPVMSTPRFLREHADAQLIFV